LMPDSGGTYFLPRLVGTARAMGLALLGEKLPAEEAERLGLIWKCVDDAQLMDEAGTIAAALGAGLPVEQPGASMIVDVGGGTTEVAVMSLCGIVYSESLRIAGDEMNQAIIHYLRRAYDLLVGERRAEDAKIRLGSAYPKDDDHEPMEVQGRDLLDGLPKTVVVTALEVREALREPVYFVQGESSKRYAGRPLPLEEGETVVWNNVIGLWQEISLNYQQCLRAYREGDLAIAPHAAVTRKCALRPW